MQVHELTQGSSQWHAHRMAHFNASDAPAMLGSSAYKTRAELLRELSTGLGNEVDAGLQRLYDAGHRYEALARPLAEQIIGEDLYPVVGSEGDLSASFDGLTLLEEVAFEHKTLNHELRACMTPDCTGADLPMQYQIQMEQQCMVAGCDRVLFMATKWADDNTLIEARHCWYTANPELATRIRAGWDQFAKDLAEYQPAEAAPVVVAQAVEHLPALSVQVNGALAVVSNLAPFGVALRAFVDRIPKKPSTDQEFADTEAACKRLKEAEDRLQAAEDAALASLSDVETMRRMVADFRELARTTRLASEKLVKQRKEQIREEEVQRGRKAFAEHFAGLTARLGGPFLPPVAHDFPGAIKSLRTIDSVRNAIDTELARAKIEASTLADRIDANLKTIAAAGSPTLFPDKGTLALKAADDLAAVIAQRLTAEQKRQDDERERIRKEEAARVERERRQGLMSELEGLRQQVTISVVGRSGVRVGNTLQCALDTLAETEAWPLTPEHWGDMLPLAQETKEAALAQIRRLVELRQQKAAAPQIAASETTEGQDSQHVLKAEPARADATDRETPAIARPRVGAMGLGQAADAAAAGEPADTRPPIKLGDICDRLGFDLRAEFVETTLGIKRHGTDKRAVLFLAADFPRICAALVRHINARAAQ